MQGGVVRCGGRQLHAGWGGAVWRGAVACWVGWCGVEGGSCMQGGVVLCGGGQLPVGWGGEVQCLAVVGGAVKRGADFTYR